VPCLRRNHRICATCMPTQYRNRLVRCCRRCKFCKLLLLGIPAELEISEQGQAVLRAMSSEGRSHESMGRAAGFLTACRTNMEGGVTMHVDGSESRLMEGQHYGRMQASLDSALAHVHSADFTLAPTVYRNPGRQHPRQPSIGRNPGLHQDRGTISPSGSKSRPI
jgi:hypothetical protein